MKRLKLSPKVTGNGQGLFSYFFVFAKIVVFLDYFGEAGETV
jgi:hypothetical protein